MHYLLTTWDGGGTVPVDFGIARKLLARGHSVTVLGDPTLAEEAARSGVELVPWREAPHRASTALEDDVIKDWECRTPISLFRRVSERLVTGPAAAFAAETTAELQRRPPDVVVANAFILGPMIAAEAAGVPTIAVFPGVYALPADGLPAFGLGLRPARGPLGKARDRALNAMTGLAWRSGLPAVNSARAAYGLPPLTGLWDQLRSCHSILLATAEAFDFPARLPESVRYVGPVMDDPEWAGDRSDLPPDDDLPLVVVGFSGTYVKGQDDLLRRTAAALATLPVRGVVCTGPTVDPAEVAGSDRVRVVRAVPHSEVFPRAAVVITHGGHGTITKALAAGRPVLCIPEGRDQPDNAVRMTERGAGLSLRSTASPERIAAAVRRLLDEPHFTDSAQELGRRIRQEIDDKRLVDALEEPARARS